MYAHIFCIYTDQLIFVRLQIATIMLVHGHENRGLFCGLVKAELHFSARMCLKLANAPNFLVCVRVDAPLVCNNYDLANHRVQRLRQCHRKSEALLALEFLLRREIVVFHRRDHLPAVTVGNLIDAIV